MLKFPLLFLLLWVGCSAPKTKSSTFEPKEKPKIQSRLVFEPIGPSASPCFKQNGEVFCGRSLGDGPIHVQVRNLVTVGDEYGIPRIDWSRVEAATFHTESWDGKSGLKVTSTYKNNEPAVKSFDDLEAWTKRGLLGISYPSEKVRTWLFDQNTNGTPKRSVNKVQDIELLSLTYKSEGAQKETLRFSDRIPACPGEGATAKCALPLDGKMFQTARLRSISYFHDEHTSDMRFWTKRVDWKCVSYYAVDYDLWRVDKNQKIVSSTFDSIPQYRFWNFHEEAVNFAVKRAIEKQRVNRIGDRFRVRFNSSSILNDKGRIGVGWGSRAGGAHSDVIHKLEAELIVDAELRRVEMYESKTCLEKFPNGHLGNERFK